MYKAKLKDCLSKLPKDAAISVASRLFIKDCRN